MPLTSRNTNSLIKTKLGREILTALRPLVRCTDGGSALSVRTETYENCVFFMYISDLSWLWLNGGQWMSESRK